MLTGAMHHHIIQSEMNYTTIKLFHLTDESEKDAESPQLTDELDLTSIGWFAYSTLNGKSMISACAKKNS